MKLAIDFGTTNTVVAYWSDEGTEVAQLTGLTTSLDGQPPLVPSLVYVQDGQTDAVVVGQEVRELGFDQQRDNRLFRNFKRGIVAMPAPTPRQIDGVLWGDREAGEFFVRSLIDALPETIDAIEQVVLTAPVAAFDNYLSWLSSILGEGAAERVFIVDESTAAALGYAVTEPGAPVLVLDFGGGTLDLSLVQLPESRETTGGILGRLRRGSTQHNMARVIAKTGRVIGGSDIDQWLLGAVLKRLNLGAAALGDDYSALLTLCEQAKIRLSKVKETEISFALAGELYSLALTRGDLEALLDEHGFYAALGHAVDKVMHIAHRSGVFREDVKDVLLVGGVSLMPSVQASLKQYFGDAAVRAERPFTAVVEGALQVAAGYGLDDYLGQGYGLRYLDPETGQHRYDEIIPMGSRLPSEAPFELILGTAHAEQEFVEFVIGEIGGESGSTVELRYEGGQSVFVASMDNADQQAVVPLNDMEPLTIGLDPPGKLGEDRLRVRFRVGEQRRLHLTVFDLMLRREVLKDTVITTLQKAEGSATGGGSEISGREPQLAVGQGNRGQRRLSLRGVANMLGVLSPDAVSLDAIEAALRSDSFRARYGAVEALSRRSDRDARLVIQHVLGDGNLPARASAARLLNGLSWYSAEPLIRQALADPDSRVRESVMYALCDLHDLNAYRLMGEVLLNEADNVREAAAFGLRDCQNPAAVPALQACLLAHDAEVRVKALEALSVNNTDQALPAVRSALDDRSRDVVYAAVLSLLEMAREDSLEDLARWIMDTDGRRREVILQAFFHATNYLNIDIAHHAATERLIVALETALRDDMSETRRAAVWPLAWMRNADADEVLKDAYQRETDGEMKAHIVRVAVKLMSAIGEALLEDALQSNEAKVRQVADEIVAHRERAGIILRYDETAVPGSGLQKPSMGR